MSPSTCPDCGAPNRYCVCVLQGRIKSAEREAAKQLDRARRYRIIAQAAVSCIAANRSRLAKPRGPDEERLLTYIERSGTIAMGPFWSGRTDGWFPPVAPTQTTMDMGDDADDDPEPERARQR